MATREIILCLAMLIVAVNSVAIRYEEDREQKYRPGEQAVCRENVNVPSSNFAPPTLNLIETSGLAFSKILAIIEPPRTKEK
jgi:hypothetical protein